MNNCPTELHSYIVRLACKDDGTTVRKLLRVSRYFHDLASPFLYQSMALEGSNAILNVATGIEKLPFHRRKICHLFISDKHISKSPANIHDHALVEMDPEVENAMLRILHLASPTLETLTCVVTDAYRSTCILSKLFRMSFPRLRELTVHGFYPYPSTPNSFPALTHLHLSGNRNPHGLLQLGGLEVACPRLSDLRISDVNGAVAFADELHDALMPPGASRREAHQMMVSKLPASIEAVIVQPASVSTFPVKCGTAKRKALMMIDRMRDTASRSEKVPLKLVESRVSGPCVLKSDWIGRLEGGNGLDKQRTMILCQSRLYTLAII